MSTWLIDAVRPGPRSVIVMGGCAVEFEIALICTVTAAAEPAARRRGASPVLLLLPRSCAGSTALAHSDSMCRETVSKFAADALLRSRLERESKTVRLPGPRIRPY